VTDNSDKCQWEISGTDRRLNHLPACSRRPCWRWTPGCSRSPPCSPASSSHPQTGPCKSTTSVRWVGHAAVILSLHLQNLLLNLAIQSKQTCFIYEITILYKDSKTNLLIKLPFYYNIMTGFVKMIILLQR